MKRVLDWRFWISLWLIVGVSGCSVAPSGRDGFAQRQETSISRPASAAQGNSAVLALLGAAQSQQQAGNFEQAAAVLERALRLEPRNAMLWHHLAQVRLGQGQWRDAIDLAAKSNSLAGEERDLQASNWLVIAQARQRQGDREGAQAARARMAADSGAQ